jgi:hypothetical protein
VAAASPTHFLAHALDDPARVGLRIARTGTWLVRTLEVASESASRKKGLLGRDGLAAEAGIVIAPSQGVHTFGMRFPIDVVGVRRDGTVVKVRSSVGPRRLVFALRAFAILELAAGTAASAGLRVGDRLVAVGAGE